MTQSVLTIPSGSNDKKRLLHDLYDVYQGWVGRFPLACRKGCSVCCTRSVSMSSLEGELILDFIRVEQREDWLAELLAPGPGAMRRVILTVNQFTRACLEQREVAEDMQDCWDFTPCIFLNGNICSIYEVRPLGCRSFISLEQCSGRSGAEIASIHLAVNTVFTQLNEHLCSDGGYWGNMVDILKYCMEAATGGLPDNLLPARPIPGFILEPREVQPVRDLLQQLFEKGPERQTFGDLIDNFMPI